MAAKATDRLITFDNWRIIRTGALFGLCRTHCHQATRNERNDPQTAAQSVPSHLVFAREDGRRESRNEEGGTNTKLQGGRQWQGK
jgi:hypothetical protein